MQLAMEAFAQDKQRYPVNMKIVAAPWTLARSNQEGSQNQGGDPDTEDRSHGAVAWVEVVSQQEGGNIDEHGAEKIQAPSSRLPEDMQIQHRIDRIVIHGFSP